MFYTYLVYHAVFFVDKYVSITILQFAICTYRNLVNLGKELNIFLKKRIVSMKSIYDLEDSFSDKSL